MLQGAGVVPVVVFDGGRLPNKDEEEKSRARCVPGSGPRSCADGKARGGQAEAGPCKTPGGGCCPACRARAENKAKAQALWQQGNKAAAFECYQRAVDITPAVAKGFIDVRTCSTSMLLPGWGQRMARGATGAAVPGACLHTGRGPHPSPAAYPAAGAEAQGRGVHRGALRGRRAAGLPGHQQQRGRCHHRGQRPAGVRLPAGEPACPSCYS